MKTVVVRVGVEDVQRAALEVLRAGGLVAFPTDTVYGLAVLPWDGRVVSRLYEAKQRPSDRPVSLLLSESSQLCRVAALSHRHRQLVAHCWPGGVTLVLSKKHVVPKEVSAGPTVGVRVPDLKLARDLIGAAGGVLAVTSANLSGQATAETAQEVAEQLGGRIDLIVDGGRCRGGIPSTVLDCTVHPPNLLRSGAVSVARLRTFVGPITELEGE